MGKILEISHHVPRRLCAENAHQSIGKLVLSRIIKPTIINYAALVTKKGLEALSLILLNSRIALTFQA